MEMTFHSLYRIKKNDTALELWSVNKSAFFTEFRTVANTSMSFCILGLIGNGILIWLLCCAIKKTRFTVYAANLAIGDFIILIHYFVVYLLIFLPSHASFYSQQVQVISLLFGTDTNIYFLTAMSAERYFMVSSPFWAQFRQQKHFTAIVCCSLWTLSFVLTILEYFFCHPKYLPSHIIGFLYCHTAIVFRHIINYLVFIPVMVCSSLALLMIMKKKPTGLDVSILAAVFLHLILSTLIKIMIFINYLIALIPSSLFRRVSLILDCVDTIVNPFAYLLVGYWKRKKDQEPLHVLIERGLSPELNSDGRTEPDQEQA